MSIQIDGSLLTFEINSADVVTDLDIGGDSGYWGVFAQSASTETEFITWFYDVRIFVRSE
jgi:hypothetical protein